MEKKQEEVLRTRLRQICFLTCIIQTIIQLMMRGIIDMTSLQFGQWKQQGDFLETLVSEMAENQGGKRTKTKGKILF